ncbi:transporter substrate-binding domain-containing protein [Nonomuraea spiralis]|uniref:transporter substrate-binding domain-containing protein n=1 Tax=Nonomuraea spiralis TaxID=46182 RepID=UPI0037BBC17C
MSAIPRRLGSPASASTAAVRPPRAGLRGIALLTAAVVTLAGCGSSSNDQSGNATTPTAVTIEGVGPVAKDDKAAALLPDRFAKDGLVIAANIPHPPFIDFSEPGVTDKFKGLDYDLTQAIAARLGTVASYKAQPFDSLIPGLQAGSHNVVTGIADLKARQEAVTFVDYSKTGAAALARHGNTQIKTLADLCGVKVAAVRSTTLQTLLEDYSKASCGARPMKIIGYPDEAAGLQALLSQATEVYFTAKVNAIMIAKSQPDKLTAVEDPAEPNGYKANPNGIGVLNANEDLAKAIQAALQSLIEDGTYGRIYSKWDLASIGVTSAVINGAIN